MNNAQVTIIGGGIQGISLAYHLARRGLVDVCLLEMDTLGSGSSGKSAAIIGLAFPTEQSLSITQWSLNALMDFEEQTGVSPGFEPIGYLVLADRVGAAKLRRRHALLLEMEVKSTLADERLIDDLTPGLNLEGIELGMYLPQDGVIDPHSIMMGYSSQARRLGVQFMEGVEAIGLEIQGGRVLGVHSTAGLVASDWVVNAAGARAREVASWAGMDLPITNLKRHILVTGPVAAYSQSIPFTYESGKAWYMRREGPGLLIGMGASECSWNDTRVEMAFVEEIIDYAGYRAPALEEAGLMTSWAGIRPMTPDEEPILGHAPHLAGFINDCGWGGHGVMDAPAAGMALAELIVDGAATTLDISHFSVERFDWS